MPVHTAREHGPFDPLSLGERVKPTGALGYGQAAVGCARGAANFVNKLAQSSSNRANNLTTHDRSVGE